MNVVKKLHLLAGLLALPLAAAYAETPTATDATELEEIVVLGVRGAEQRTVELKRDAASITDSISAEDIGKLPDRTIADSLQRITGVQINREGGEGSSVSVRGLPQVGTLLNGAPFLTTGNIVSVQPDFSDIPSQLFAGADVIKSPTATLLNGGITGTIDLKTRRPFELDPGWTATASGSALYGNRTEKWQPEFDGLIGFHGERWGLLASAAYSDATLEHSFDGMGQYSGELVGETSDNTVTDVGFLGAYNGGPLPPGLKMLHPTQCIYGGNPDDPTHYYDTSGNGTGCNVDVNGDGKANGVFYNTADYAAIDEQLENKRLGVNASFQADLGLGMKLTSDFFYTDQKSYDRQTGYQLNSANWDGATFLPLGSRNTGVQVYNGYNDPSSGAPPNDFYVTSSRQFYIGDVETYSDDNVTKSQSRNFNLQLAYDQGGPWSGEVRGVYANASSLHMESYLQYAISNGSIWKNDPTDALPPPVPPQTYAYVVPGGSREFNPYGIPPSVVPATIDFGGNHMGLGLPQSLGATMWNRNAYALKTVTSEGDFDRSATMGMLRADGHFKFSDHKLSLDFGIRQGYQAADNENFSLIAPVYPGLAYYNPSSIRSPARRTCRPGSRCPAAVTSTTRRPTSCSTARALRAPARRVIRPRASTARTRWSASTRASSRPSSTTTRGCTSTWRRSRASTSTRSIPRSWTTCSRSRTRCIRARSATPTRPTPGAWTCTRPPDTSRRTSAATGFVPSAATSASSSSRRISTSTSTPSTR